MTLEQIRNDLIHLTTERALLNKHYEEVSERVRAAGFTLSYDDYSSVYVIWPVLYRKKIET